MGFDHPKWGLYSTSKHGTIWQIEGTKSKRAPTCQTCHMSGGDHKVMTSWGFLALRLPEDDKDWMNDTVTILQALGVLDEKGNPTARLDLVKAGKVARLTKEEFQKERDKMIAVCASATAVIMRSGNSTPETSVVKEFDKWRRRSGWSGDSVGTLKKPTDWDPFRRPARFLRRPRLPWSGTLLMFSIRVGLSNALIEHRYCTGQLNAVKEPFKG